MSAFETHLVMNGDGKVLHVKEELAVKQTVAPLIVYLGFIIRTCS